MSRTITKYKNKKGYDNPIYQQYLSKTRNQQIIARRKGIKFTPKVYAPSTVLREVSKGIDISTLAKSSSTKAKSTYIKQKDFTYETYQKEFKRNKTRAMKYNVNASEVKMWSEAKFNTTKKQAQNSAIKYHRGRDTEYSSVSKILKQKILGQFAYDENRSSTRSRKYAEAQIKHLRKYDSTITISDIMYGSTKYQIAEDKRTKDFKNASQQKLNELFEERKELKLLKSNATAKEIDDYNARIGEIDLEVTDLYETFYGSPE